MNGYDDENFDDTFIEDTVEKMVDVAMFNMNGNMVTDEGLEDLSDLFSSVHPMDRERVFIEFLNRLEDEGVDYNIRQFRDYDA